MQDIHGEWHFLEAGEQRGPVAGTELKGRFERGELDRSTTHVWSEGMADWRLASDLPLFAAAPAAAGGAGLAAPPAMARPGFGGGPNDGTSGFGGFDSSETRNPIGHEVEVKPVSFLKILMFVAVVPFGLWIALFVVLAAMSTAQVDPGTLGAVMVTAFLGVFSVFVYGAILFWTAIYRAWNLLRGSGRTTAGLAVGLSFIPLFNLYWMFVVYSGWAKDFNAFRRATGRTDIDEAPEGLFLAMPILTVCTIIPLAGYLAGLANLIVFPMCIWHMCKAVNAFADAPADDHGIQGGVPMMSGGFAR